MKLSLLAVVVATMQVPSLVSGQTEPIRIPKIGSLPRINEQLNLLSARIDREMARGLVTKHDAEDFQREINDLQAESSDERLQNGGPLKEGDRFDLQARISRLKERLDREIAKGAAATPR
jgi:hypothetical protein